MHQNYKKLKVGENHNKNKHAWKQRKLSEVSDIVGGGTPNTNDESLWNGNINWFTPAEIGDEIFVSESKRKISDKGLNKSSARILPANKTVLFTSRAGIGKMAILSRDSTTNQGFQSIIVDDNNDPYFIFSMGAFIKKRAEKIASGSTFAEISGKLLGKLQFKFPSLNEQQKIGTFFSRLDNTITLQQRWLFYTHKQS